MKFYVEESFELLERYNALFIDYQINEPLRVRLGFADHSGVQREAISERSEAGRQARYRWEFWNRERLDRQYAYHEKVSQNLKGAVLTSRVPWGYGYSVCAERLRNQKVVGKAIATYLKEKSVAAFMAVVAAIDRCWSAYNSVCEKFQEFRVYFDVRSAINNEDHINVPWVDEPWFTCKLSTEVGTHLAHVSVKDSTMLAYHQSIDKMARDIQTPIKPGRYLAKYFSDVLSANDIKYWADKFNAVVAGPKMELLDNDNSEWDSRDEELGDAWIDIYNRGPSSCMQGEDCVAVYGLPGNHLGLAYFTHPLDEDNIIGRAIVRTDKKFYVRAYVKDDYISIETVEHKLEEAGYTQGTLDGISLRVIESNYGDDLVFPYLDGGMNVDYNGCDLVISRRGEFCGQTSSGTLEINLNCCERCGDRMGRDEGNWIEIEEMSVCDDCVDSYYIWAKGRHGHEYWVSSSDAVEVDGTWYHTDYLERYDIYECADCGDYHKSDDLHIVHGGDALCEDCVRFLDEEDSEGNRAARPDECVALKDGRVIHQSVEDDYTDEDEEVVPPAQDTSLNLNLDFNIAA